MKNIERLILLTSIAFLTLTETAAQKTKDKVEDTIEVGDVFRLIPDEGDVEEYPMEDGLTTRDFKENTLLVIHKLLEVLREIGKLDPESESVKKRIQELDDEWKMINTNIEKGGKIPFDKEKELKRRKAAREKYFKIRDELRGEASYLFSMQKGE